LQIAAASQTGAKLYIFSSVETFDNRLADLGLKVSKVCATTFSTAPDSDYSISLDLAFSTTALVERAAV
jgi:hypothetical protein